MSLTSLVEKIQELEQNKHLISEAEYQTLKEELLNLEKRILESGEENKTIHWGINASSGNRIVQCYSKRR